MHNKSLQRRAEPSPLWGPVPATVGAGTTHKCWRAEDQQVFQENMEAQGHQAEQRGCQTMAHSLTTSVLVTTGLLCPEAPSGCPQDWAGSTQQCVRRAATHASGYPPSTCPRLLPPCPVSMGCPRWRWLTHRTRRGRENVPPWSLKTLCSSCFINFWCPNPWLFHFCTLLVTSDCFNEIASPECLHYRHLVLMVPETGSPRSKRQQLQSLASSPPDLQTAVWVVRKRGTLSGPS